MRTFVVRVEFLWLVPIDRLHHADPREHRRLVRFRDHDQCLHRRLPLLGRMLSLRKLRDVIAGILERDEQAAAGQLDRFIELSFPALCRRQVGLPIFSFCVR
jgi:hypothetical protein